MKRSTRKIQSPHRNYKKEKISKNFAQRIKLLIDKIPNYTNIILFLIRDTPV